MTRRIIAKYSDKRACPSCGTCVERLGETWHSAKDDEFYFTPRPVRAILRKHEPEFDRHRWSTHTWRETKVEQTPAGERDRSITHTEYEYLVDFYCPKCDCVMQERDTKPYLGATTEEMLSGEGGKVPKLDGLVERMRP